MKKKKFDAYPPFLRVIRLAACASTNDYLANNHEQIEHDLPVLVTASEQTRGRGRHNREWVSKKGLGVYASFAFHLKNDKRLSFLPLAAGLAVIETLEAISAPKAGLKWPNDIMVEGKKIAGILIENKVFAERVFCIAGIGINLNHSPGDFPGELQDRATSLKLITGKAYEIETTNRILAHLFFSWLEKLKQGRQQEIAAKANEKSRFLLGKEIAFHQRDQIITGVFRGIHDNGGAIIEHPPGTFTIHHSGEITNIQP